MPQQEEAMHSHKAAWRSWADTNQQEGPAPATQPLASFEVTFTQRDWLYCRITLPSQLAALCWNMNSKNNTLKCSKPQARHKQPSASSDEEPDHRLLHGKTRRNQQAHGAWRHLPDLKLPCVSPCQPWAPSARLSVPRTQTCSRATVSDMKTSQLSTFQTKWTLPCWCNHWQAQLSLLWTEKKNHLHSQTEAKCHFANISRKGIVLCLPNISRRYYGGVGSLLMSDNSIKMYHSDKKNIYIFSVVHFWKEASWHTNRWCIEQVTNTCSNKNVCNFFHWAFKIYWQQ